LVADRTGAAHRARKSLRLGEQHRGLRVHPRRRLEGVCTAGISKSVQEEIERLGSGSIATPEGYLAFLFLFFVLVLSLFVCAQVGAARHEEADQRLETMLALPVGRLRWLGSRLLLATGAVSALALVSGLATWLGTAAAGVGVSLLRLL